jgi:hypothetical protein
MSLFIIQSLRPLLRFMDPTLRTSAKAGADVVDLTTDSTHPQERGYFTLNEKDISAPDGIDEDTQQGL